jgi:hypothetical protein
VTVEVDPEFPAVADAVLAWLQAHGHPDAHLTEDAGHGAWDVESAKVIAEINLGTPPSRPNVQRLDQVSRGAERPAYYFSTRGFTSSAQEWANNVNIALFSVDKSSYEISASNELAETIAAEPPSRDEQLLAAAARAVAAVQEELHTERQLAGLDDETRERIEQARETKRMRRNLLG